MTAVISAWVALTIVLGLAAWIAVWSRRPTRLRLVAILAFLAGSPVAFFSLALCLGWPVPLVGGITGPAGEFTVLGQKLVANQAIYILIDTGNAPRYYVLPWDQEQAKKLQDAADKQAEMRVTVPPMELSWERRKPLSFHEIPQPKVLPDKPQQAEAPTRFDSI